MPKTGVLEHLELGGITTFSSMASIGKSPPQGLVPAIDRALDESPLSLWTMCYAIFWKRMPKRKSALAEWKHVLAELVPEPTFNPDGVPVPSTGLSYLVETIKQFATQHSSDAIDDLVEAMEYLEQRNRQYVDDLYDDKITPEKHELWHKQASKHVERMRRALNSEVKKLGKGFFD